MRIFLIITIACIVISGCASKTKYIVEPVVIDNCTEQLKPNIILPPRPKCLLVESLPDVKWSHVKDTPQLYVIRSIYLQTLANNIESLIMCIENYNKYVSTVEGILNEYNK